MAKDCGPSLELGKLTEGIDGAKGELDSLIGTGTEGIAGNIAGLKDKISGLTDGISTDLDSMIPEIPQPEFKLQDSLNAMLSGGPGELMTNFAEMKEKLGDKVDLDKILGDFGLDTAELNAGLDDYKDKLSKGDGLKNKLGDAVNKISSVMDSNLVKAASGDLEAIATLTGGVADKIFKGSDATSLLDKICTQCPNIELEDGKAVEKGPEAKVPQEDAVNNEPTVKPKEDLKPETKDTSKQNADALVITQVKEDQTQFGFGPLQTNDTVAKEKQPETDYEKELKRLAKWQERARAYVDIAVRDKQILYDELNEYGNRVPPLDKNEFENTTWRNKAFIIRGYVDALSEFTRLYMIQIARKYGSPGENDSADQEFTIGTMTYKQPKPKKGEKYFYPREQYNFYFMPNEYIKEETSRLRKEIDKFDMIEISSEVDFMGEEHVGRVNKLG